MTTTNLWAETIPAVTIELMENGNLRLEDKSYSEFAVIDLHPVHVRLIAEEMGLLEKSDPDLQRQVDAAERRMDMVLDRINALHRMLENAQNDLAVLIGKPDLLALPLCHLEGTAVALGVPLSERPPFFPPTPPKFPTNTPESGGLQESETKSPAPSIGAEQGALL